MAEKFSISRAEENGHETVISEQGKMVVHYTCNPPDERMLKFFGIKPIGQKFGRQPREVLAIPIELIQEMGYKSVDPITIERLLVRIGTKTP